MKTPLMKASIFLIKKLTIFNSQISFNFLIKLINLLMTFIVQIKNIRMEHCVIMRLSSSWRPDPLFYTQLYADSDILRFKI